LFYKVLFLAFVAGCGFSPLYKNEGCAPYNLKIATFPDRDGQILKNELLVLFPNSSSASRTYSIDGTIVFSHKDLALRKDATAKRQSLSLRVNFELYDSKTGDVVYKDYVVVDGGYNVLSSTDVAAISMIASDNDTKKSMVIQAAKEIKLLIESYWVNQRKG
jgi:hypothetical protein